MASMPHREVKVDSSQVARLIEMADQLRQMSDDLRDVIREHTTYVETHGQKIVDRLEDFAESLEQPTDCSPDDPYGIDKSAREHSRPHKSPPPTVKELVVGCDTDDHLSDAAAYSTSTVHKRVPLEHTGTMKLTREMKLTQDDPDAIQDAP